MDDQRRLKRMHVYSYIRVDSRDTRMPVGRLKDITAEGMRLYGDQPLELYSTYRFKMILPNIDSGEKREICFDANVVWCRKDGLFDTYDAGIQMINVSEDDRRVIENFMECTCFEERWLSGQRLIPQEY